LTRIVRTKDCEMRDSGERSEHTGTPEERYREFADENAQWDRRIEETLRELDEADAEAAPSESEATPA
jgi:hypothetical protein